MEATCLRSNTHSLLGGHHKLVESVHQPTFAGSRTANFISYQTRDSVVAERLSGNQPIANPRDRGSRSQL